MNDFMVIFLPTLLVASLPGAVPFNRVKTPVPASGYAVAARGVSIYFFSLGALGGSPYMTRPPARLFKGLDMFLFTYPGARRLYFRVFLGPCP